MKKVFLSAAVLAALSSCSSLTPFTNFVDNHCETRVWKDSTSTKTLFYAKCKDLYPTEKLSEKFPESDIHWDVTHAGLESKGTVNDTAFHFEELLKSVFKSKVFSK
jgi:hypothetical protein